MIYVDTSALIPYYFQEMESYKAQEIFSKGTPFILSELNTIEFLSASNKKIRLTETTYEESQKALSLFKKHRKSNLYIAITLEKKHYEAAETILKQTRHPLRSLDAIHLGIIYSEEFTLFSFDTVMNETAREFNIPVIPI